MRGGKLSKSEDEKVLNVKISEGSIEVEFTGNWTGKDLMAAQHAIIKAYHKRKYDFIRMQKETSNEEMKEEEEVNETV